MKYYNIIVEESVPALEKNVNQQILAGWACLGAPFYINGFWHQAMKLGGGDAMFPVNQ